MRRLAAGALLFWLVAGAISACSDPGSARLQQEKDALTTDVRRLEREAADLRARLERARDAIDLAQDHIDAAQNELGQLPDSASEAADNAAARLDDAADALDNATDATEGDDLTAPVVVRAHAHPTVG